MDGFPRKARPRSGGSFRVLAAPRARSACLVLAAALAAAAQPIDIRGVVRDESGQPLPGFVVTLKNRGLADTTDERGEFHLLNASARGDRSSLRRLVYSHRHGFALRLSKDEAVAAEINNGAGRAMLHGQYSLKAGDWSLKPRNLEPGLYTVKLWTGKNLRALRLEIPAADTGRGNPEWMVAALTPEQSVEALAPPAGVIVDSLRLEKAGYPTHRVPVRSWSEAGINISARREAGERTAK